MSDWAQEQLRCKDGKAAGQYPGPGGCIRGDRDIETDSAQIVKELQERAYQQSRQLEKSPEPELQYLYQNQEHALEALAVEVKRLIDRLQPMLMDIPLGAGGPVPPDVEPMSNIGKVTRMVTQRIEGVTRDISALNHRLAI